MASGIHLKDSIWSTPFAVWNIKQNRRVMDLHWMKRDRIMLSEAP